MTDWEYFTEGSSSGDDSSFYDEEGLWESHKNIHHIEGLSEEKKNNYQIYLRNILKEIKNQMVNFIQLKI